MKKESIVSNGNKMECIWKLNGKLFPFSFVT